MSKTFVNDDFKQALLDVISGACRRHQTTPMSKADKHYTEELVKIICSHQQTNETLIQSLERFLPTMLVDVNFLGMCWFRRKSDLVAGLRAVLKAYPISRLQHEEIQFLRETIVNTDGLEKAELLERLIRVQDELANVRSREDELRADHEVLIERLREAYSTVENQNRHILLLEREKAALEARVTHQGEEIEGMQENLAHINGLLAHLMQQPHLAVLWVNEAEPMLPVYAL